ncbi:MAG: cytochrome c oxidase subunit II [Actinobacteria bacterium]|nr:MAG: cytochrome c oxidase subunit II [Actinomycetota bacterium]
MRRGAWVQLILFALVATAAGLTLALAPAWLPVSASRERDRMDFVFWFVVGICIFIMAIVASTLTYMILRFRARPDDDSDGPPIHGHTGLEIGWTAVPTVLVTAIGIVSAIVLGRNDNAGAHPFRVNVTAQQFAWSFSYPEAKGMTTFVLRLPVDRSVLLRFTSKDVIHSFWVPEFGQKQDTVPGLHPTLHITPTRVGTYPVICTELCGLGHAVMRTTVTVMKRAAFDNWLRAQTKTATSGNAAALGATVFKNQGCGACHTFKPAGATAKIGPDLDKLPDYAKKAGKPLADFVRQSIVDPSAYVEKGYPDNVMPKTFKSLPKSQLDALVQYLTAK